MAAGWFTLLLLLAPLVLAEGVVPTSHPENEQDFITSKWTALNVISIQPDTFGNLSRTEPAPIHHLAQFGDPTEVTVMTGESVKVKIIACPAPNQDSVEASVTSVGDSTSASQMLVCVAQGACDTMHRVASDDCGCQVNDVHSEVKIDPADGFFVVKWMGFGKRDSPNVLTATYNIDSKRPAATLNVAEPPTPRWVGQATFCKGLSTFYHGHTFQVNVNQYDHKWDYPDWAVKIIVAHDADGVNVIKSNADSKMDFVSFTYDSAWPEVFIIIETTGTAQTAVTLTAGFLRNAAGK